MLNISSSAGRSVTCMWSGVLPSMIHSSPVYSCKVFLGGVPWDVTEDGLQTAFRQFGQIRVEFPGNTGTLRHPRFPMRGYVYIIFEQSIQVQAMLSSCSRDALGKKREFYFKISSRRIRNKEVQVIPWILSDNNYVDKRQNIQRCKEPNYTIFVGALHGSVNAKGLATVMSDLFGNVLSAGIFVDMYQYPSGEKYSTAWDLEKIEKIVLALEVYTHTNIGSGRVSFSSKESYMRAVKAAYVIIRTKKFVKKVQIDPYLEDSICSNCAICVGSIFCRNWQCFAYYCSRCWGYVHSKMDPSSGVHSALVRYTKSRAMGAAAIRQVPEIKAVEVKPDHPHDTR